MPMSNDYYICSKCGARLTQADTIPCELAECPVTDEPWRDIEREAA